MDSSAICQKECQTTLASLKCWTWPINNVLAHLDQNKSLQSSGLSLLLTHRLHTKTQAVPELKALGSRVLNTCPRIPGPSWFCLLWLSLSEEKSDYPACPRVTIWAAFCSECSPLPSLSLCFYTPWQQKESLNKWFRDLAAKVSEKTTFPCMWKDHLAYWLRLYPCMAPLIASLLWPV